ncbi:MAG: hypothetical protein R3Y63_09875 [Eubacteriales bacterium]
MSHAIGDNSHGNSNEQLLVAALNGKKISNLDLNLKEFMKYIAATEELEIQPDTKIQAKYEPDSNKKQDLYVTMLRKTLNISLKMGSGNSVHQEKCEDFVAYIKTMGASEGICDEFRFLLWSDGTLDGSGSLNKDTEGKVICRFNAVTYKKQYPERRETLQTFLNLHEEELIRHFLFVGRHNSRVDFLYHGTPMEGVWVSSKEVIRYQLENSSSKNPKSTANLTVGRMNVQSWNVSLQGNSDHKRGQIQLKYSTLRDDLLELMNAVSTNTGTFFGDTQEFQLTRLMNHNKSHPFWNIILPEVEDYSDYFLVKVENKVLSSLSGQKVNCKSDAYVIKHPLDSKFLLQHQYTLNETRIKDCHKFAVVDTGISIKIKDSSKFTYQKLTKESFMKAFSPYVKDVEYLLIGLLLYSKDSEVHKNEKIFSDFGCKQEQFLEWVEHYFQSLVITDFDKLAIDSLRRSCQEVTKDAISNNEALYQGIFTGLGWFESPYYISFIYKNGTLSQNYVEDFTITTGSGRSRGSYSIEIKPK